MTDLAPKEVMLRELEAQVALLTVEAKEARMMLSEREAKVSALEGQVASMQSIVQYSKQVRQCHGMGLQEESRTVAEGGWMTMVKACCCSCCCSWWWWCSL